LRLSLISEARFVLDISSMRLFENLLINIVFTMFSSSKLSCSERQPLLLFDLLLAAGTHFCSLFIWPSLIIKLFRLKSISFIRIMITTSTNTKTSFESITNRSHILKNSEAKKKTLVNHLSDNKKKKKSIITQI